MTERCDAMSVWVGPSSRFGGGGGETPRCARRNRLARKGLSTPRMLLRVL